MFNSKTHHKGKYTPINKNKYIGDITNIRYLSAWERCVCIYLDKNPDVIQWNSESTIVHYRCPSDDAIHKYLIDFTIKYASGKVLLVEVKPYAQTILPKATKGKAKSTLLNEHLVFMKNKAKWVAANEYAINNGASFVIWSENKLKLLGIPII